MGIWELILIAVGLSMDAFAVSVCKGLSVSKIRMRHALTVGLYFGGFQALMPAIGYLLGTSFQQAIVSIDHWIAFLLLSATDTLFPYTTLPISIGVNMIREACSKEEESVNDSFSVKTMIPLAVATSIDALAVGVTFAFLQVQIIPAVLLIGSITCILSMIGLKLGNVFGDRYQKKAELAGGIVLIGMGLKILLEHLGVL